MNEEGVPPRITLETLGSGAYDPREWRKFDKDEAKVSIMYGGDDDLSSVVVWCLEPGQENSTHKHPDSAHFILILEGEGVCLRGEEGPPDPIRAGQVLIVPRNVIHGIRNTGTVNLSYAAASTAGYKREAVGEQQGRWATGGGH
jgi:quercetin dioxygenase-like cupin family protein